MGLFLISLIFIAGILFSIIMTVFEIQGGMFFMSLALYLYLLDKKEYERKRCVFIGSVFLFGFFAFSIVSYFIGVKLLYDMWLSITVLLIAMISTVFLYDGRNKDFKNVQ
jgi:apolipoprotein N-acyltransferase